MTADGTPLDAARTPSTPSDRRRFPRASITVPAELLVGTRSMPCHVTELSPGGALLAVAPMLPALGMATLRIEGAGAFHCRIAWSRGGRAGICFLHDADWNAERLGRLVNPR